MIDPLARAYDAHPYPGHAYWFTHPDHLGVLARLHGLAPAPPDACRVLELGAGDGGNLLPLAEALPDSHFVGVDLSEAHVLRGVQRVGKLGLTNVELIQADLRDLGDTLGTFDFIIAHGLVSWIPADARAEAFALIGRALAPDGVAMVSFNAYPGWHDFEPVRRLMAFHTEPIADPAEKVAQARAMARWYCARVAREAEDVKGELMLKVFQRIADASDAIIRHDYLAEHHQPFYFLDFVDQITPHGLAFMTNARHARLRVGNYDDEIAAMLRALPDANRQQQYMDFFSHTRFRTVALCRAERTIDRAASLARFADLAFQARTVHDVWAPELRLSPSVSVATATGAVEIHGTPLRIALSVLHRHAPAALDVDTLFELVLPELIAAGAAGDLGGTEAGQAELALMMLRELVGLYFREVVHLWQRPPRAGATIGARPRTGRVQRLQAAEAATATSLDHRHVTLEPLERDVLARLDGRRTVDALRAELGDGVDAALATLARAAFLFAEGSSDQPG